MKLVVLIPAISVCALCIGAGVIHAGPFPPAAGQSGSTAVFRTDSAIASWAEEWSSYIVGDGVNPQWQTPAEALGPAEGTAFDIVSLGRSGSIRLEFPRHISDGPGPDFAVFENAFSDTFLELAYVEVSQDGINFVRLDNLSLTQQPVGGFGNVDPTDIDGFGGKYRQGYGTPFDIAETGLNYITHIRLVDVVGDGSALDSYGNIIHEPYPTAGSAGFDLDAVAVINETAGFTLWQIENFTAAEIADPSIGGESGNRDGDLHDNLAEYGFGLNAAVPDGFNIPLAGSADGYSTISFPRNVAAADLLYQVEASGELIVWSPIAQSAGGAPTQQVGSPGASSVSETGVGTLRNVTVSDSQLENGSSARYLRITIFRQ